MSELPNRFKFNEIRTGRVDAYSPWFDIDNWTAGIAARLFHYRIVKRGLEE